jgi:hypothetical protein
LLLRLLAAIVAPFSLRSTSLLPFESCFKSMQKTIDRSRSFFAWLPLEVGFRTFFTEHPDLIHWPAFVEKGIHSKGMHESRRSR